MDLILTRPSNLLPSPPDDLGLAVKLLAIDMARREVIKSEKNSLTFSNKIWMEQSYVNGP